MSTDKKRILVEIILSCVVILLAIALILLIIFIRVERPNRLKEYTLTDISIMGLESFDFIENKSIPEYPYDNLGITGNLILDCHTGTCIHEIYHEIIRTYCDEDYCDDYDESWTEYKRIIDHNCSEQCYETGNDECNCSEPYNKIGTCKNKTNDEYKEGKVCYAYNTIIFWKGKKYTNVKISNYSFLEDSIILKDEDCPKGTKNCGIIDDNGDELCINLKFNCPINYISENKLSDECSSVLIGNKTFYYGNDNTTKRKIIAGLVVDTDLLLNKDNEQKDIIDNYTISGLLEDNQNLYKDVNLGYDPYKIENIDSKGSSYLRIFYNDQNVNLSSFRENKNYIFLNHKMNKRALDSIHYKTKIITILGLIALGYLLLVFFIILYKQYSYYKKGYYGFDGCNKGFYACFIIIFIGLMITPLIFGCINIKKANDAEKMDFNKDYSTFRNLNIAFIAIGFALFLFLIVYIVIVPIKCGFEEKNLDIKPQKEKIETSSTTVNNIK